MKAVFAATNGEIELREFPRRKVSSGELGIRTVTSLISSGTERHYLNRAKLTGESFPLGYCAVGVVECVGPKVEGFSVGDHVAALGWGHAFHAEYINVPYRLCAKLPAGAITDDRFVFAPLAATALHMIRRSGLLPGEKSLFVGLGPIGQLGAQIAQTISPNVYAADLLENRLRAAEAGGAIAIVDTSNPLSHAIRARTAGEGVAVVFLCVSGDATELFHECILSLHCSPDGNRKGRLIPVGRFRAEIGFSAELGNVDIRISSRCGSGYRDECYVRGESTYDAPPGQATVDSNLKECVRLIEAGDVRPEVFHTHRIPFSDAKAAYDLLRHNYQAIGITLHYGQ